MPNLGKTASHKGPVDRPDVCRNGRAAAFPPVDFPLGGAYFLGNLPQPSQPADALRRRICGQIDPRSLERSPLMKKLLSFKMLLAVILAWAVLAVAAGAQEKPKSLYARLGGYDAIAAVTDDFFGRMMKDPQLGRFFKHMSEDSKVRARQLTVDLLCQMTGGPCFYTGRDMKKSHQGMGITDSDWDLSVKYLKETLNQFKVPDKEQQEVLQAISGTRKDIVEVKK